MKSLLLFLSLLLTSLAFAQERPQSTAPAPGPERHKEIRDSIRAKGRVKFVNETDEEYRATRIIAKDIRALRIAAFVDNPAYSSEKLLKEYDRFIKRKKGEPVMYVRAPEGGVQIHVKERRGKIRLITLMAYGDEGAAVIRLKSKFSEKHLKQALELMKETAKDTGGVVIDTEI